VAETLGELAIDDPRHATFRETVRVFLETGGSFAATAERLSLHRNTVQYRVRTAEEMRHKPFREGRLDVELALEAAHWFGRAVLQPPSAVGSAL
jgi:DNA-binding PucR family transcriptional regulator